ncbi:MAG: archaellin/type IV pilin N-terminal domain-containing protein [Candidatus Hodarchaeales archaeon]|jgi:flagellin-like protein
MNIRRLIRRRRAVSPILAAILLIGLAVAAGAVLFTVVMPLIDNPGGSVVFDESTTTLTTTGAHIVLKNEGTETASITDITIDNGTDVAITFVTFTINKGQGAIKDYSLVATAGSEYTITVSFTVGTDTTEKSINIKLTP